MRPHSVARIVALALSLTAILRATPTLAGDPAAPAPAPPETYQRFATPTQPAASSAGAWTMPGSLPAISVAPSPTHAPPPPPAASASTGYYQPAPSPAPARSTAAFNIVPPAAPSTGVEGEPPGPRAAPRDYHFDLGVGTEVPLSVGGVLTAELPHRFLLQVGVGVMPKAYSDMIDGFLTTVGAYDTVVSQVVRSSLGSSLVVRASAGGRPFADHGFEILGGYTLVTGGGSVASTDVINAILVESGAAFQAPAGVAADIPVSATLHNFHASLGWRWLLASDRLVIRASLSYLQTVDSRITVKVPASATAIVPYEGQINQQVNAFLNPYFAKYGKAPTLGLSAAFRF